MVKKRFLNAQKGPINPRSPLHTLQICAVTLFVKFSSKFSTSAGPATCEAIVGNFIMPCLSAFHLVVSVLCGKPFRTTALFISENPMARIHARTSITSDASYILQQYHLSSIQLILAAFNQRVPNVSIFRLLFGRSRRGALLSRHVRNTIVPSINTGAIWVFIKLSLRYDYREDARLL